jgi:hypothetical protein
LGGASNSIQQGLLLNQLMGKSGAPDAQSYSPAYGGSYYNYA